MTEHIIYYVRAGENEELRYSLRSLAVNGPKDLKVTIIGDPPEWVNSSTANIVPGNPFNHWGKNTYSNLLTACDLEPGDFWSMNDDFISLKPWPDPFPVFFRSSIQMHMSVHMSHPNARSRRGMFRRANTYLINKGLIGANHYEMHIPMKINGTEMLRILDEAGDYFGYDSLPIWRTLYANLSSLPSAPHVRRNDVIHHNPWTIPPDADFLSTNENTFGSIIPMLESKFPDKSPWEL